MKEYLRGGREDRDVGDVLIATYALAIREKLELAFSFDSAHDSRLRRIPYHSRWINAARYRGEAVLRKYGIGLTCTK